MALALTAHHPAFAAGPEATLPWVDSNHSKEASLGGECAKRSDLQGRCYWIHGRMQSFNGGCGLRITWLGTTRRLGVCGAGTSDDVLAPPVVERYPPFNGTMIYGDFLVCPFTPDEPKAMRLVCVEEVRNIVVEHFDWDAEKKTDTRTLFHVGERMAPIPYGIAVPVP